MPQHPGKAEGERGPHDGREQPAPGRLGRGSHLHHHRDGAAQRRGRSHLGARRSRSSGRGAHRLLLGPHGGRRGRERRRQRRRGGSRSGDAGRDGVEVDGAGGRWRSESLSAERRLLGKSLLLADEVGDAGVDHAAAGDAGGVVLGEEVLEVGGELLVRGQPPHGLLERLPQGEGRGEPVRGLLGHGRGDDVHQVAGDGVVVQAQGLVHHGLVEVCLRAEGNHPRQTLVEQDAQEVDVRLAEGGLAPAEDLLGGAVPPAPHDAVASQLAGRHRERPVAGDLHVAPERDQERLRPDVPVDERRAVLVARQVGEVHPRGSLGRDEGRVPRRERAGAVEHLAQRLAVGELDDAGQPIVHRRQPVHPDDVGVLEGRRPRRLLDEPVPQLRVGGGLGGRPDEDDGPGAIVLGDFQPQKRTGALAREQRPQRLISDVPHGTRKVTLLVREFFHDATVSLPCLFGGQPSPAR